MLVCMYYYSSADLPCPSIYVERLIRMTTRLFLGTVLVLHGYAVIFNLHVFYHEI